MSSHVVIPHSMVIGIKGEDLCKADQRVWFQMLLFHCLLLLFFGCTAHMWDLSSLNKDWICFPALWSTNFNHWTTKEVSSLPLDCDLRSHSWESLLGPRWKKSMLLRKSHIDWNLNLYDTKYFSTPFFSWIICRLLNFVYISLYLIEYKFYMI